ncbi:MAG: hypothetical protein M1840_000956 [Geoglossum simile]|nr:MAG: hypothetical protein M1840_000956 [Geoglossum simile]
MAPKPRQSRAQTQPITTTLANILRDYPAGSTVLRELLQNADDAGASKIDFHLSTLPAAADVVSHPLLHPELREYQGPAVVAHNNHPPFSPGDFESLSNVGDSLKRLDVTKTGKFGLGFNSVYNWTDAPSVLSGSSLLLLDPHHSWSAVFTPPGGPVYDFVDDADQPEMANQLIPFSSVLPGHDFRTPLDGTAIRVPLRTEEQALKSRICQTKVGVEEVREVLKGFAEGFDDGYGLFLKSVREIGIWEDGRKIGGCRMVNEEEVKGARTKINEAYSDVFVTRTKESFYLAFNIELEVDLPGGGHSRKKWAVHHAMLQNVGPELTEWGRERKLFAWVGVAVPFQGAAGSSVGGLFTVLPLDKPSGHPAHIHGMFSITSDRASIHSRAEKRMQDQRPFLWNEELFNSLIPVSWANLLDHLRRTQPKTRDLMDYWPRPRSMIGELGEELHQRLFDVVQRCSFPAFFTEQGFVRFEEGLFVEAEEVGGGLRVALKEAGIPVVYVQQRHMWLYDRVKDWFPMRLLSPKTLCDSLRPNNQLADASVESKKFLLEFVLSTIEADAGIEMLYGIPLFRLDDETYLALEKCLQPVFVNTSEIEKRLFRLQPERNLDVRLLSAEAVRILGRVACTGITPIRRHSTDSLIKYCHRNLFLSPPGREDVIPFSPTLREFIDDIWSWIAANVRGSELQSLMSSLWLIPLHGGYLHRCGTSSPSAPILHSLSGTIDRLLVRLASSSEQSAVLLLLDPELLSVQRFLIEYSKTCDWLALNSCENLMGLLSWLVVGKEVVCAAADEDKRLLLTTIAKQFVAQGGGILAGDLLKQLPLFEHIESHFVDGAMEQKHKWINHYQGQILVGMGELPFTPEVDGTVFVQVDDRNVRDMLCAMGIASWPTVEALLGDYLLPSLTPAKCDVLPDDVKVQTLELLLRTYLSTKSRGIISTLPIVPVDMVRSGIPLLSEKQIFRPMSELVDPEALIIQGLFFLDELLYPRKSLLDRFSGVMQCCGLRSKLTQRLILDQLQIYATTERPLEDVEVRVQTLLQLPTVGNIKGCHEVTDFEWIVAKQAKTRQLIRLKPRACVPVQYLLVVGRVLSVLRYGVHADWEDLLPWSRVRFDPWILEEQLQTGIEEVDMGIVNEVLTYISQQGFPEEYMHVLRPMSCVLGGSGKLFPYNKVFQTGATGLLPYLDVVDRQFRKQHATLLGKLDVARHPGLDDLLRVQERLVVVEQPLSEDLTAVAIEVVVLASVHDRSKLTGLKLPDRTGTLHHIEDITLWDMQYSSEKQTTPLVHDKIPIKVVRKLAIGKYSDKILQKQLGIHDEEDEDEYNQHEDTTSRIADTLGRYSITSTFNEYLANAEDAEATCIDWLLDDGSHPTKKLVSPDLRAFQGPALFVHNDGVFGDDDFEGFKKVGRGSKREEQCAIGQFGRGAQTMYHWTDVPMLISGKYLVILDPQREYLPLNYKHGSRKPGMKLELSNVRKFSPDQLVPFDGLWDYDKDLDEYGGTIFRFPLRPEGTKSKLTENTRHLGLANAREQLERYFPTARISLLFLQNINRITFGLRHAEGPQFQLERSQQMPQYLVEVVNIRYRYINTAGKEIQGTDDWRLARQDIPIIPKELQEMQGRVGRGPKYSKCGIAAPFTLSTYKDFTPSIFSTLPLPFGSCLPVHINASFALSGDRRNILVEEASLLEGSNWNKWLLQESIPELYLLFLEDLARTSTDVFRFWPTTKLANERLSDLVRTSFWEKVPSSRCRLYPQAKSMAPSRVIQTGRGKTSREPLVPVVLWELKEAMFDFLCTSASPGLQDLVRSWFGNIVRVGDSKISSDLRRLAPCEVTPAIIRGQLRVAEVCNELEKRPDRTLLLRELFRIIKPTANQQWNELDGCRILPLQDGLLGTIHLTQSSGQTYFRTTAHEQGLFSFASNLFMKDEIKEDRVLSAIYQNSATFPQWLVESSAFNVRDLTMQDLGEVLRCRRNVTDWAPGPALETWLGKFWSYFNQKDPGSLEADTSILVQCGIDNFRIFRATKSHNTYYISPKEYESLPAVPRPSDEPQLELCQQFPDLYIVDPCLMPFSFADEAFFPRFLTAINTIATSRGVELETLLATLNERCTTVSPSTATSPREFPNPPPQVLRRLTLSSAHPPKGSQNPASGQSHWESLREVMRQLPVWPSASDPGSYVAATKALVTPHSDLLVPWLRCRSLFIEPAFSRSHHKKLSYLGVRKLSLSTMFGSHIIPDAPPLLQPDQIYHYLEMLRVVVYDIEFMLQYSSSNLAIDGAGRMCRANQLYDHKDDLYSSGFGLEHSSRFLHPDIRIYHTTFSTMGLRGGPRYSINASEYLACIKSLQGRVAALQPSDAVESSCRVLQGLSRLEQTHDTATRRDICDAEFVYSGAAALPEPAFRKSYVRRFKECKEILKLSEVIRREHTPYCWTQARFSRIEIPISSFQALGLSGSPPSSMVWDHLRTLVKVAATLGDSDTGAFLSDLSDTYSYLQRDPSSPVCQSTERIWLNINLSGIGTTASCVNNAWIDAEHLILFCPYDPGDMQAVRPYLKPYQDLLKRCGCQPIRTPTLEEVHRPDHNSLPSQLSRFWKDSKLTDIAFETEGKCVFAHKLVLAAASEKYENFFTGNWASPPDARNAPIVLDDINHATLLLMLDFAYHDHLDFRSLQANKDEESSAIADKLDVLFDLLAGADQWLMPSLHAQAEFQILLNELYIRPDNVRVVLEVANRTNSKRLARYCVEYIRDNSKIMAVADRDRG